MAEERLGPEVQEKAIVLSGRHCLPRGHELADKLPYRRSAPWHYVNIPNGPPMMTQPSVPTTSGSQRNSSDSQNTGQSLDQFQNRQNPLKYIIPFVEHLHQSLHAGDNRQRGGNDVQVEFMSQINYKPPASLKE